MGCRAGVARFRTGDASGSQSAVLHRNAIWISEAIAQGLSRVILFSDFMPSVFSLCFSRLNVHVAFPLEQNPVMAVVLF